MTHFGLPGSFSFQIWYDTTGGFTPSTGPPFSPNPPGKSSEQEMCKSNVNPATVTSTVFEALQPATFVPSANVKSKRCFSAAGFTHRVVGADEGTPDPENTSVGLAVSVVGTPLGRADGSGVMNSSEHVSRMTHFGLPGSFSFQIWYDTTGGFTPSTGPPFSPNPPGKSSEQEMCKSNVNPATVTSTVFEALQPATFVPSANVKSKRCFSAAGFTHRVVGADEGTPDPEKTFRERGVDTACWCRAIA